MFLFCIYFALKFKVDLEKVGHEKKFSGLAGVVAHNFNSSTPEGGRSLRVPGQPDLHRESGHPEIHS